MSDAGGKFRIITTARNNTRMTIDLGSIQSVTDFLDTVLTSRPIPSKAVENCFVFDTGVRETYTISFARVCPSKPIDSYEVDSVNWSNGFWMYNMLKYVVNRWQALTDGVRIFYVPSQESKDLFLGFGYTEDDEGNITANGVNCYVTDFTPTYNVAVPYVISGQMKFAVGGIYLNDVVVSKIIYYSNFGSISSELAEYDSNLVKISSDSTFSAISFPTSWVPHIGSINPSDIVWSDTIGSGGDTYAQGSRVRAQDGGTLRLYARYPSE